MMSTAPPAPRLSSIVTGWSDVGNPALSWLSPIGWYQAMHPFSGLRWWPALLLLALAAVATAAAYLLFGVRDFDFFSEESEGIKHRG